MRAFVFLRGLAASLALVLPLCAAAQAWPNKPIKWIIPYPPGGITDSATRMVVQKVQEQTGWAIVVENKPVPIRFWGPILWPARRQTATPF